MNQERRKRIEKIAEKLNVIHDELSEVMADEQEYFDNIPENLQSGESYEKSEEALSCMDDVVNSLESICDDLEGIL